MHSDFGQSIQDTEKYSSAITLSDMEVFIFPELMYSLVLANIMSPVIWSWLEDPWFRKIDKMKPYRRILRLKQFIIDHYEFNLDLETWGLTTQSRELARFADRVDPEILSRSNALFGYEGDKYYFDIEIRRHFGLDKYTNDTIPYWKTETVEAMDAFRHRDGYSIGAGECVSLATLYAAALFVICKVPLDDIFLMATPLHSQNFLTMNDGLLTNNRRLVTKTMWFNGTELTAKAQRALRHEQVTIVAHHTGYIHVMYPEASISPDAFERFSKNIHAFLTTEIDMEILLNFLRQHREFQLCFQFEQTHHGKPRYIPLEHMYHYEHGSSYKVNSDTRDKLLQEIDGYEFFAQPLEGRIMLNKFEEFFRNRTIEIEDEEGLDNLMKELDCKNERAPDIIRELIKFVHLKPRLPIADKQFRSSDGLPITPDMSREEIIEVLQERRVADPTADLAFYAFRDLARIDWGPFLKAAMDRNPVCIEGAKDMSDDEVIWHLESLPNDSIYDSTRAAQPDEVWNYRRGDGLERAFCLANIWKQRHADMPIGIASDGGKVNINLGARTLVWPTGKGLTKSLTL
ncbi:MAG: hypothetical protein EOM20_18080 [Spartobacteria bacterium]|nr:hypothetical protein [Spartobacteria bacterium]